MAEIPQARFTGPRWTVAMCDKDWQEFCAVPPDANERLTVVLEHFCEFGEEHLPGSSLRWLTADAGDPPNADVGAFEALGVVLRGRRALTGDAWTFFVTQVAVDPPPAAPPDRRRRNTDDRQGFLPLPAADDEGDRHG